MAINNPNIAAYKPFYIKANGTVYETMADLGLIAKSNPYNALPKAKTPYSIDWSGEDGAQEYTAQMHYESFEFKVGFYIRAIGPTAAADIRDALNTFFSLVKNGTVKVYDSYTAIGRKDVRYVDFEEKSFSIIGDVARLVFDVTFKCNAPTVFCAFENGDIVDL